MKKKIILGLLAFVMMFTFTTFNSQEAAATKKKIAYVSVKSTYMYKKADRKTKIMSLKKQTAVTYYSMTKPMVKVKYKGKIGYIPAKNLIFLATESEYTTYDREGKMIAQVFKDLVEAEKTNQSIFMKSAVNNLNQSFETYREQLNSSTLTKKQKQQLEKKHIHPYLKEVTRMKKYLRVFDEFSNCNANRLSHKGREHLLKAKEALEDTKKYIKANKLRPISSKNLKEFQKIYDEYDIFLKASGK